MSIGKFVTGTTLATPAIGGAGYITYEQLTKDKSVEEDTEVSPIETESTEKEGQDEEQRESDVVASAPQPSGTNEGVEEGTKDNPPVGTTKLEGPKPDTSDDQTIQRTAESS